MAWSFTVLRLFLLVSLLVVAVTGAAHSDPDDLTGHIGSTREELLSRREDRRDEYTMRYEEMKKQWEDHEAGRRRLREGPELDKFVRKMRAYEEKLGYLNAEMGDRHVKRLLQREEWLNQVHRDRIMRRSEL